MNKKIIMTLSFAAAFFVACGDDSSTQANELSEQGGTNRPGSGEVYYGTLVDERDGQTYKTVKIGNLVWMAENLNYDYGEGAFCYNNDLSYCEKYGHLYTWKAAMDACPSDWFLPSKYDMETRIGTDFLKKSDSIDFFARVAGGFYDWENFKNLGITVRLWSSTEYTNEFFAFSLRGGGDYVEDRVEDKSFAFSVRCVQWQ